MGRPYNPYMCTCLSSGENLPYGRGSADFAADLHLGAQTVTSSCNFFEMVICGQPLILNARKSLDMPMKGSKFAKTHEIAWICGYHCNS